jgi:hypothetical protein
LERIKRPLGSLLATVKGILDRTNVAKLPALLVKLAKTGDILRDLLAVDLGLPARRNRRRGLKAVCEPAIVLNEGEGADHRPIVAAGHLPTDTAVTVLVQLQLGSPTIARPKRLLGRDSNKTRRLLRRRSVRALKKIRPPGAKTLPK